jgi:hypothetical protein
MANLGGHAHRLTVVNSLTDHLLSLPRGVAEDLVVAGCLADAEGYDLIGLPSELEPIMMYRYLDETGA